MTSTDVTKPKKRPSRPRTTTRPRRTGRPTKYDWDPVRVAYIEGLGTDDQKTWPTLKDLSDHFDIPYIRIREKSSLERWTDQRSTFMNTLEQSRQKERARGLAKQAVQFDDNALNAAKLGMAMVTARLTEIARGVAAADQARQQAAARAAQGMDFDPDAGKTWIKASELELLSRAAQQWHSIGQRALGTDAINANLNIQADITETTVSVTAELTRDDPERLAGFLEAAARAGLLDTFLHGELHAIEDGGVIEGELVGDDDVPANIEENGD